MYMAISAESPDNLVTPELQEEYHHNGGKDEFLLTSKYHNRIPGLFKKEFLGTRMIALSSKCYYTKDENLKSTLAEAPMAKFSCKHISKKQNSMSWERHQEALHGSLDKAQNTGFRLLGEGIMTYTQEKIGLSAYYDKQIIAPNAIHMLPLR